MKTKIYNVKVYGYTSDRNGRFSTVRSLGAFDLPSTRRGTISTDELRRAIGEHCPNLEAESADLEHVEAEYRCNGFLNNLKFLTIK
jgi:hypothetical protein